MNKNPAEHALAIVIINFRTPLMTTACLASLLPEVMLFDCKIVVVDNHSGDNSCSIISKWMDEHDTRNIIELIESSFNGGFSYGNNLGIKSVKAKSYILLNSDTHVQNNGIANLLETADAFPNTGLVSPRMEGEDGLPQESCFRVIRPISEFAKAAQTGLIDRLLERFQVSLPLSDEISSPPWTSFACVLIKADLLDDVGLLDDGFFMYFEDAEFCMRARRAGWDITNNPSARIVHMIGGSSKLSETMQRKKRLPRYYYEARTRFFYQAYGRAGLLMANIFWTGGRLVSKLRQLIGRKDKAAFENQWLDIWINFGSPMKPYTHPERERCTN